LQQLGFLYFTKFRGLYYYTVHYIDSQYTDIFYFSHIIRLAQWPREDEYDMLLAILPKYFRTCSIMIKLDVNIIWLI